MPKTKADPVDIEVGQRIRLARIEAGMSQEELAEALGLTFQQVQKYEKAKNRCGPSRLAVIAKATGKDIAWFFAAPTTVRGNDVCSAMLVAPGGLELAQSYLAIENPKNRRIVANIATALAAPR